MAKWFVSLTCGKKAGLPPSTICFFHALIFALDRELQPHHMLLQEPTWMCSHPFIPAPLHPPPPLRRAVQPQLLGAQIKWMVHPTQLGPLNN